MIMKKIHLILFFTISFWIYGFTAIGQNINNVGSQSIATKEKVPTEKVVEKNESNDNVRSVNAQKPQKVVQHNAVKTNAPSNLPTERIQQEGVIEKTEE